MWTFSVTDHILWYTWVAMLFIKEHHEAILAVILVSAGLSLLFLVQLLLGGNKNE